MGAKTWMLVYANGNAADGLKGGISLDKPATMALLELLYPNEQLEPIADGDLSYTNPPDDVIYAGCFGDVAVLAAKEFAGDLPSQLESRFIDKAPGENIFLHAMHSVVDWFAFAKWQHGNLVRSLSLSPDSGIMEDFGEKLTFEADYWEGKHPAVDPEEDDEFEYPFAFHPLDLGEAALKEFFGYQLEGYMDKNMLDPEAVPLLGFRRSKLKPWWKFW